MSISKSHLYRVTALMAIAASLPVFAAAQRGGMAGSGATVGHAGSAVTHSAPAPPAAIAPGHAVTRIQGAPTNTVRAAAPRTRGTGVRTTHHANNFSSGFDEFGSNDVPGLGFDFPHMAAIRGNTNTLDRHRNRLIGGAPFFDGFLFGSPSVIVEPAPAEAQPEADEAIAGNGVESAPVRRSRRYEPDPSPVLAVDTAPPPDAEQFVLVRRDGGLVFAVAYSWENGTLRYITPEGMRRTIGRDALDLSATEQMNEQRGLNFRAPA